MTHKLPDETIIERINEALAKWASEGPMKPPDRLFLGMRDAFALDRVLGIVTMRYKGMDVLLTGEVAGISLGRVY